MSQSQPSPRATGARWTGDLLPSLVVFLVALPLCMGIALASGVSPAKGLLTGIIGGLVVGLLSGAPLQVSGPAAGLSVMVWELVQTHGIGKLGVIVLIAGLLQLAAGLLRLGQWFRAVSPSVIQGMLAGIGVLIFASQFHVMVDDGPKGSGLKNLLTIPLALWKAVSPADGSSHQAAAAIGLLTIGTLVAWQLWKPRRLHFVPGPLVAVLVGTLAAWALDLPIKRVTVPDNLLAALAPPSLGELLGGWDWALVGAGVALALIASAETLLCATAVDQMHQGPRTQYDRELAAQGVGNMLCGLVGALPMTGVIVRSAANVEAGARTRASAVMHGAWLLLCVAALPGLLARIPTACLAAILVFTGYKLVNVPGLKKLARYGRSEVAIAVATLTAIVVTDLLTGVVTGLGLSLLKLLGRTARLEARVEPLAGGHHVELHLEGAATFVRLPQLAAALERIPTGAQVRLRADALGYVDAASLELLHSWSNQHARTGGKLEADWDALWRKVRPAAGAGAALSVQAG